MQRNGVNAWLAGALVVVVLCLAGCATDTGTKWYAPATWFSHAPAATLDKAGAKQDVARDAAVKAAQKATHETAEALAVAPASRPVEVATEANAQALALLDQAAGPLTAAELAAIRKQVAGLISENAALRAESEKARAGERANSAALSEQLAAASAAVTKAQAGLREAFDRENTLANELRTQHAIVWIVVIVAVIFGAAYLYARYALGGIPVALGSAMRIIRERHPDAAKLVEPILDSYLNRHEQATVAAHAQ